MFNIGAGELLVILVVALIVLGPEKLPGTVRKIGNVVGELRRMSQGFEEQVRRAMDEATTEVAPDSAMNAQPRPADAAATTAGIATHQPRDGEPTDVMSSAHTDGEALR